MFSWKKLPDSTAKIIINPLTPEFFGTVNLCNGYFPFPDSVPDTVMADLDVRDIL